jgi:signal transduction histidine kinase
MPVPIIAAVMLLLFSRSSVQSGFVRPVQSLVAVLRRKHVAEWCEIPDPGGVSEVGEITRGIIDMAQALERSRDAVIHNERQAALGALVPVVAHNIRNPLASIRATAQLLDHDEAEEEVRESQAAIVETVDRLERWVGALVSYLHPLQPQYRTTRAAALFDATVRLLEPRLGEKAVTVVREPWDAELCVEADPDLMEQALYALLTNALEASPQGAAITISISADTETVSLAIRDQGGGIPFMPQPAGLEPGPTTKKRGTGLGIPVAFKVCKAHAWDIEFEIEAGVGTRVILRAPLHREAQ